MLVDLEPLKEYPYTGEFYTYEEDDSQWGADPVEKVVFSTVCDIQEAQKLYSGGSLSASYNVYFPFEEEDGITIQRGMKFRGEAYGLKIEGDVIGVFPYQMGGCACYVRSTTV